MDGRAKARAYQTIQIKRRDRTGLRQKGEESDLYVIEREYSTSRK